jgi:uncharacterized membrane protein (UPF0127 family)
MAVIRSVTSRVVLADRADVATGMLQRMVGLLSRATLAPGEALVLPRCHSIHTCFMRFPIDVIFLKSVQGSGFRVQGVVVKVVERMEPFRLAWAPGADTAVELPTGTISTTGTARGELLEIM